MPSIAQNGHKLRVSKPTLEEIDQRIAGLEASLGRVATRADVQATERRIIERIDELGRALGCEDSPSASG